MNSSEDTALVVSVHADHRNKDFVHQNSSGAIAIWINLKWAGKHNVADFNLDRLGRLMDVKPRSEHTGWALIEPRRNVKPGDTVSLR